MHKTKNATGGMPKTKNATGAAATECLVLEMQRELDHLKSQVVIGGFSVEPLPGIASVRLRKTGATESLQRSAMM
jgi:hypothetical protein